MDQYLYKLKDNVSDELKKIAESGLTKTNLDTAHKLVEIKKGICKIDMLEGQNDGNSERYYSNYGNSNGRYGGYSRSMDGDSMDGYSNGYGRYSRDGSYSNGYSNDGESNRGSYASRGQHYVRGHYSHDGNSEAKGRMENCKMEMMDALDMIERNADQHDKQKIREYRKALESMEV